MVASWHFEQDQTQNSIGSLHSSTP